MDESRFPDRDEVDHNRILACIEMNKEEVKLDSIEVIYGTLSWQETSHL